MRCSTLRRFALITGGDVLQAGLAHPALHVAVFVHAGHVVNVHPAIDDLIKHDGRAVFDRYNNSGLRVWSVRRFKNPSLALTMAQRRLVCSSQATLAVTSIISVAHASTSFFMVINSSFAADWLISAACPTPACPRFAYGPTNRDTALSVFVFCIPPLCSFAPPLGLVTLRQTFVRRRHRWRFDA